MEGMGLQRAAVETALDRPETGFPDPVVAL